jgi:hypothetical protein
MYNFFYPKQDFLQLQKKIIKKHVDKIHFIL